MVVVEVVEMADADDGIGSGTDPEPEDEHDVVSFPVQTSGVALLRLLFMVVDFGIPGGTCFGFLDVAADGLVL